MVIAASRAGHTAAPVSRVTDALDFIAFSSELNTLLGAGLSLMESITAIRQSSDAAQAHYCSGLQERLRTGLSLSAAMCADTRTPPLLAALVEASEVSSQLGYALDRYADHARQVSKLRQKIRAALVYPGLVMSVGGVVILFLLLYVMPRFGALFQSLGTGLPGTARLIVAWSEFISAHGPSIAVGAIIALAFLAFVAPPGGLSAQAAQVAARLPKIGELMRTYALARYFRTGGVLLESGIPVTKALELAGELLPARMQPHAREAVRFVREGVRPSLAFEASGLTTPILARVVAVGERSANLGAMMREGAAFHERHITRTLERWLAVLEPSLMIAVGLGVGVLVVMMYIPIFELASALE